MTPRTVTRVALFGLFVGCVLAANYLTDRYGFVSVGFGLTATAGTYAAGLSFGVRDALHETGGRTWVVVAIVAGAVLSALVDPDLALASGAAFLFAETADLVVYERLRAREWTVAVAVSNVVGSLVDTLLFLWLAGFPIRDSFAGQMVGKASMIAVAIPLVWGVRRALPRHRQYAGGT